MSELFRCPWAGDDPLYQKYHDTEWGVPVRDDLKQFEFLILEGFQAGLSWITILKKREAFRQAFQGFDPEAMARFTEQDIQRLLADSSIVRNKLKVRAAVTNARAYLDLREKGRGLADLLWSFVDGAPITNSFRTLEEVPASTDLATKISKELKSNGFSFVGPTIVYAHMQATGLVNDHLVACFRYEQVRSLA